MTPRRKHTIVRAGIAVLCLLAGALAGWFVFTRVLGKEYPKEGIRYPAGDNAPRRDTMYVKMVDSVFALSSPFHYTDTMPAAAQGGTKETEAPGADNNAGAINWQGMSITRQTGTALRQGFVQDISSINTRNAEQASALSNKLSFKEVVSWLYVWVPGGIALLIFLVAFFAKDDAVANATLKDVQPEILDLLFVKLKEEIERFHNPRKVLRYRNAVSYHYFFLKQKQLDSESNVEDMMRLLLAIHRHSELVDPKGLTDDDLSGPGWFLQKLKARGYTRLGTRDLDEVPEKVVMLVLSLNVNLRN